MNTYMLYALLYITEYKKTDWKKLHTYTHIRTFTLYLPILSKFHILLYYATHLKPKVKTMCL